MRALLLLWLSFLTGVVSDDNICGLKGIHDEKSMSYYMGNFFYKGPQSFSVCALYCKKDAGNCQSFRYSRDVGAGSQYCEFFGNRL